MLFKVKVWFVLYFTYVNMWVVFGGVGKYV